MTFANTGHLTASTIHTNSALETIDRLLGFKKGDQKIDKYLLLSVLKYVSAQMLVP
jgi:Tfp pilus assembly pilus retraction ATPase PilT